MKIFLNVLLTIMLMMVMISSGLCTVTTTVRTNTEFYSTPRIIDVPPKPSCPKGQRKDAHGMCRIQL